MEICRIFFNHLVRWNHSKSCHCYFKGTIYKGGSNHIKHLVQSRSCPKNPVWSVNSTAATPHRSGVLRDPMAKKRRNDEFRLEQSCGLRIGRLKRHMFLLLFKAAGGWCKRNPVYPPHSAIKYEKISVSCLRSKHPTWAYTQKKKPSRFDGQKFSVPSCSLNRVDFWRWIFSAFIKNCQKCLKFYTCSHLNLVSQLNDHRPPALATWKSSSPRGGLRGLELEE